MTVRLFVYGTLKEGFPNYPFNVGRRLPGLYRTKQAFPLLVVRLPGEDRAPWLLDEPGQGLQVLGQVFEIDPEALRDIDELEEVGRPTGYIRKEVELEWCSGLESCTHAFAYFRPSDHLGQCLAIEGPFSEYTQQLAQGYWLTAT